MIDDFRSSLLSNGLVHDAGVEGLYDLSYDFEAVVRGIETYVMRSASTARDHLLYFPPLMARSTLVKTGYVKSFPNLIGSLSSYTGTESGLLALNTAVDADESWTDFFSPIEVTTCSAACHNLYPLLQGRTISDDGVVYEVQGSCFRHEPSTDVARMQSFRMRELIYLGDPDRSVNQRDEWLTFGRTLLSELGLTVDVQEANDPFFGRGGRVLAQGQRDKQLKFEILCHTGSESPRAIASANYHEDHFGVSFDIRRNDDQPVHSACFGFGLERITLALLAAHGLSLDSWPADVLEKLALRPEPSPAR